MMDFANIQNIVIPEGEVDVIARGSEILWQKQKYKRELLYLESTGTQWIDIDTTINTATDEVEFVFQNTEPNVYKWFFGEHDNNARFGLGSGDGANKRNVAYGNNTYKVSDTAMYNTIHTFEANQTGVFIDGAKVANFASFASISTLYLFNLNLSGGNYACSAKVWSYKHSRNGVLIRDLIPAIDANDIPCMYDKVSGKLFYNQGSGRFEYAEIPTSRIPSEYQEVEYLENTGTQYIDTGKFAPANTDIEVRFKLNNTAQNASNNGAIFGGRDGTTAQTCTLFYLASTKPQYFRFDRSGQVQIATADNMSIDADSVYTFSYGNDTVTMVNERTGEKQVKSLNKPSTFTKQSIQLFAVGNGTHFKGRIYEWKYSESGELLQHFIPCYRKADGEAGMYDLVTETFFTNKGTGEFLYSK